MNNILFDTRIGDVSNINMPIGETTPSTGAFTTLSTTGAATLASAVVTGTLQASANVAISGALVQAAASITASTTHSIAGATPLAAISLVNAANANDAVKLPIATKGLTYCVITVGSTATPNVYPGQSADTIDGGSAGASVTLLAAHRGAYFICAVAGNWTSTLFGAVAS